MTNSRQIVRSITESSILDNQPKFVPKPLAFLVTTRYAMQYIFLARLLPATCMIGEGRGTITEGWAMSQAPRGRYGRRIALLKQRARAQARRAISPMRTSHPAHQRLRQSLPWFMTALALGSAGLASVIISMIALGSGKQTLADSIEPIGALLLVVSGVPLVIGVMTLIEQPARATHRCGLCQFYRPAQGTYQQGTCASDRLVRPLTRYDGCGRFTESQRAMVRDRLSDAPHVLNSAREL